MTPMAQAGYYVATPKRGRGPGVLVLHSWWGLTPAITRICDRLGRAGFVALAPDLFEGATPTTPAEADDARRARRSIPTYRKIEQAIDVLHEHDRVAGRHIGIVGLSMGGHWALWLAARPRPEIGAIVAFYAVRASNFSLGPDCAFQLHLAGEDPFVSREGLSRTLKRLEAAGRRVEVHQYPDARHWFFEDDRPEHDAAAAQVAWRRTVAFLRARLTDVA